MKKGNLPLETAFEPKEAARKPSLQKMPPSRNKTEKTNITFANSEKSDSQTNSTYKDLLSQPAPDLPHRQRLLWLQKRRTNGLWVQCDKCDSWRYLPDILDSYELPSKWYCTMNPDSSLANCSAPEDPIRIREEEDLIHSEYAAGSLVLARLPGWPWWPAMVDDCPDTEQYYWLDGFSDIPTHYNVVFFDAYEVTRAWMAPSQLKPYSGNKDMLKNALKRKAYRKRLDVAITQSNDAENLTLSDRLAKYSFIVRYKGPIASPKKITTNDVLKYQGIFKRKFNINFPSDSSDSECEINNNNQPKNRRNVITLGSKKISDKNADVPTNINVLNSVKDSLDVQVDTKSLEKNDATETTMPETTAVTQNIAGNISKRKSSVDSDDFDF